MDQPIPVSPALARDLGVLMRHLGRTEARIDLAAIEAVQRHRHVTIPDEVRALMAASGEPLHDLVTHDEALEAFFRANGSHGWKARVKFAHVSFTAWGDWPRFHGVFDASGRLAIFSLKTPQFEAADMSRIVRERWPMIAFDDAREVTPCMPTIQVPDPTAERRVSHPRFGIGRVLADEDGKLRIDFGEAGVKTLLARFVTEA